MGHETGHVVARHAARGLITAYGLEAAVSLAAGDNPGLLTQLATTIAANGLFLKHSRDDETEADELGVHYLSAAGYDPNALITFFHKLQAQAGSQPGFLKYLSDHPATGDRINHLQQIIATEHLGGSNVNAPAFQSIKQRVRAYASAPGAAPGAPAASSPSAAAPRAVGGATGGRGATASASSTPSTTQVKANKRVSTVKRAQEDRMNVRHVTALAAFLVFGSMACDPSKPELDKTKAELATITAERDSLKTQLEQANAKVTALTAQNAELTAKAAAAAAPAAPAAEEKAPGQEGGRQGWQGQAAHHRAEERDRSAPADPQRRGPLLEP
jgi:hypothetical protein